MLDWLKKWSGMKLSEKVEKIRAYRNELTNTLGEMQKITKKHDMPNDRFDTLVSNALFYSPRVFFDLLLLKMLCFSVVRKKKKQSIINKIKSARKSLADVKADISQEIESIKNEIDKKFPSISRMIDFRKNKKTPTPDKPI